VEWGPASSLARNAVVIAVVVLLLTAVLVAIELVAGAIADR
jgi:hypothetical protein